MLSLDQRVSEIEGRKILIVGDICLDEYVWGAVKRISPEAPVPIVEVNEESQGLGMSAFVASNVVKLGGEPLLVSAIGTDSAGEQMRGLLEKEGVSPEKLIVDSTRPTTRKMRVLAQDHHIVRVDYENKRYLAEACEDQLIDRVGEAMKEADGVIIQDYAKGVISRKVVEKTVEWACKMKKKVLVDPNRETSVETYAGVDLIKPNLDEALALSNTSHEELARGKRSIEQLGEAIMRRTRAKKLVITRGKEGMTVFEGGEVFNVPTYSRQVFDVTGAGDAVIAALSMALFTGWDLQASCRLANFAAGLVVSQVGCVPCDKEELKKYISSHPLSS